MIEELVAGAREGVARRSAETPISELETQLAQRDPDVGRPFNEALVRPGLSLVAEFKRRSPAVGEIRSGVGVDEIVTAYEAGGAAALSVLTDEVNFGGSLDDLRAAREACDLPVLRKDLTVDTYQLYESAVIGADAILLIVAALDDDELARLHGEARALDLDCVVEIHDEDELDRALRLDADVLGINNRNLDDFSVDLQTTFELMPDVPAGKAVMSESGIATRDQLEELEEVGVDAVLVGEALMRADDPEAMVRELTRDEESTREHFI